MTIQVNEAFFDTETYCYWNHLTHVSLLTCIAILNLENVMDVFYIPGNDVVPDKATLIQDPDLILSLCKIISTDLRDSLNIQSRKKHLNIHGAFILGFGAFLQRMTLALEDYCPDAYIDLYEYLRSGTNSVPQLLIQRAYSLDSMGYLNKVLGGSCYTADESNSMAYRSVVKGLLTLFFSCFPVNRLPDTEIAVECFGKVFNGVGDLCRQFWEEVLIFKYIKDVNIKKGYQFPGKEVSA